MNDIISYDREGNKIFTTGENKFISVKLFEDMFGKEYTFESLYNHENATEMWKKTFNEWKQNGIIK